MRCPHAGRPPRVHLGVVLEVVDRRLAAAQQVPRVEGVVHVPPDAAGGAGQVAHAKLLPLQQGGVEVGQRKHDGPGGGQEVGRGCLQRAAQAAVDASMAGSRCSRKGCMHAPSRAACARPARAAIRPTPAPSTRPTRAQATQSPSHLNSACFAQPSSISSLKLAYARLRLALRPSGGSLVSFTEFCSRLMGSARSSAGGGSADRNSLQVTGVWVGGRFGLGRACLLCLLRLPPHGWPRNKRRPMPGLAASSKQAAQAPAALTAPGPT
jgi:hypothetical protein